MLLFRIEKLSQLHDASMKCLFVRFLQQYVLLQIHIETQRDSGLNLLFGGKRSPNTSRKIRCVVTEEVFELFWNWISVWSPKLFYKSRIQVWDGRSEGFENYFKVYMVLRKIKRLPLKNFVLWRVYVRLNIH